MATARDACYYYKRINKLNNSVLKLGVNDTWRPSPPTKYKGGGVGCCQHTDLTYCRGCAMYHVCEWCSQYDRCFLDNQPHLLRMRTFKNEVTKNDLMNLIDMYNILFPINQRIVDKFISSTRQHKCRNECMTQWYNHLLMPITLQSLSIELDGDVYYVFGYYDSMGDINQTPFSFTNLIDMYDKLLLDNVNFNRMSFLPVALQQGYALRYFSKSRFISGKRKCISDLHFSTNVIENLHNPSFKIQITRNCSELSSDWNGACKLVKDMSTYFNVLKTSHIEFYSVSTRCRMGTRHKLKRACTYMKPNYGGSFNNSSDMYEKLCNRSSNNSGYFVRSDFTIKWINECMTQ
ncbi:nonstructural protein 1, partial [Rotavirus A]